MRQPDTIAQGIVRLEESRGGCYLGLQSYQDGEIVVSPPELSGQKELFDHSRPRRPQGQTVQENANDGATHPDRGALPFFWRGINTPPSLPPFYSTATRVCPDIRYATHFDIPKRPESRR